MPHLAQRLARPAVDHTQVGLSCLTCGTTCAADGWCPNCLVPDPSSRSETASAAPGGRGVAPQTITAVVGSRYGASSVSFGPVGRVVITFLMILPPLPALLLAFGMAGWGFAAIWWGVVTPWTMRDLWRRSTRRVEVTSLG